MPASECCSGCRSGYKDRTNRIIANVVSQASATPRELGRYMPPTVSASGSIKEPMGVSTTEERATHGPKGTHGEILKSSAMVGGSQLLNVIVGMVRTKAIAMMLGPGGFGLFGLYNSISSLVQTLAGMGINGSGVRQIAAAASMGEEGRIAETSFVLRRVSMALGSLGAGFMIIFARQICWLTFHSHAHVASVRLLSIAVFLTLISGAQSALIQGMRRIADLAKLQVLGALAGAVFSIPLVYRYRERGIVPSLICVAATGILTSWWFSRKVAVSKMEPAVQRPDRRMAQEVGALLKLGLAFMVSSLTTLGVAYAIRIFILRTLGIAATGLYQSAWTLGGFYVGIILQAMGADFYPRLTANAHDNQVCNRLTNEQTLVGLVVAGPGVIGSLTLAPLIIALFYSAKFGPAVGILRWICLGAFLQIVSFPMGYIIIAKAERALFIACEIAWGIASLGLAWYLIPRFGLVGAGASYFGSYVFHCMMIWTLVRRLSGFRWSRENIKVGVVTSSLVAIAFSGFAVLPAAFGIAVAAGALLINTGYAIRVLTTLVDAQRVPARARMMLSYFRLMRPVATEAEL
jgi:antigen flippase